MTPKEAAEEAASLVMVLGCSAERGVLGGFGSVLFPVVHLLLELPGLFLVDKGQASPAFLELEGVEEGPIGIVRPCLEDFLIPYDTPIARRYVHHLEPIRIPHQVIGEDDGTLPSCVVPSLPVWVGDVESGDGDGLDFIGLFWDKPLDGLLVLLAKDGGHSCRGRKMEKVAGEGSLVDVNGRRRGGGSGETPSGVGLQIWWSWEIHDVK